MNFYVIIEDATNKICGFLSAGDSFDPPVPGGRTKYPIDHLTFDSIRTRDKKRTKVVWDSDSQEVYLEDADQAALTALAWAELRSKRDSMLAGTDQTQLPDFPQKNLFTAYRQALRDLPENTQDPTNPVWPVLSDQAKSYLKGK
jgi:hypothetical protein